MIIYMYANAHQFSFLFIVYKIISVNWYILIIWICCAHINKLKEADQQTTIFIN